MAEISSELLHEILKDIQARLGRVEDNTRETKAELSSIRGHMLSIETDVNNIYRKIDRQTERLERIERRLELRELAEPQRPFEP
jgi:predicted  nucleic acid-binding Zn-ribbon protein